MNDEFYEHIKLVSGEEILATVCVDETNEDEPILIVNNPVVMKMLANPNGSFIKVKPWMELSNEDLFVIKPDKIIAMTETKDPKIVAIYEKYLREEEDDTVELFRKTGKVDLSNEMGYVSNVDDARDYLEEMYNKSLNTDG